jgi:hypothetical protein
LLQDPRIQMKAPTLSYLHSLAKGMPITNAIPIQSPS